MMFSGTRASGRAEWRGGRRDSLLPPEKEGEGSPPGRSPDGTNIAVTSENGVTEFTFTLMLA